MTPLHVGFREGFAPPAGAGYPGSLYLPLCPISHWRGSMWIGGGFGPSSGRIVEACEPHETARVRKTKSLAPAISVVGFVAVYLGVPAGMTLLYFDEILLGGFVLAATAAIVSILVVLFLRGKRSRD